MNLNLFQLGGALSDRFGRRRAMSLGMSVAVPAVAAGAMVQSYAAYVALRLVTCTVIVFSWISVHNFQVCAYNFPKIFFRNLN